MVVISYAAFKSGSSSGAPAEQANGGAMVAQGLTFQVQGAQAAAVSHGKTGNTAMPQGQRLHAWEVQSKAVG